MKIKILQFNPEEIIYVVVYRHRIQKKVKITNKYHECINRLAVLKITYIGTQIYFSHIVIPNLSCWEDLPMNWGDLFYDYI